MAMNGNGNFTGKVAFVTGAGGGIGRATALAFARARSHVAVADVSEPNLRETASLIEELGGRALGVRCDVTRAEEVKGALDRTIEAFGRLDFAFNNAGVEQPIKPVAELTEAQWDRIVDIDLRSVFLCMKYEIPLLLKQGGGAIVNTSSGRRGQRHRRSGRVLRREIRHRRPYQGGGPRLCGVEPPHQRRVPRDHRNPDDGPLQREHPRGTREGNRAGAGWQDGEARGDRCGRRLAVLGCGRLRRRARPGRRWRPNGVVRFVASREGRCGAREGNGDHARRFGTASRPFRGLGFLCPDGALCAG